MARGRRKKVVQEEPILPQSKYPDLTGAIEQLKVEKTSTDAETAEIIEKWYKSLMDIEAEMRHLERIEKLSSALKNVNASENKGE
ncbi:MAG: hypothetical protein OSB62_04965 [Alphaproteobacteria bacterium]|nr:hypothetical protein [Alphaproteobacteria bacterium]